MLCKRIIPCLDVRNGRTVKGINFSDLRDVGDPVELGELYQDQGADELVFLDISATHEGRKTMLETVEAVARRLMIPFTVGGGVGSLADATALLQAGADKVSINSAAVRDPEIISAIAETHGAQCCVLAIDARSREGAGWDVLTHGGRRASGREATEWAREATAAGAGEILLTSWDKDGTRDGFDLTLTRSIRRAVSVPVIASGGGGSVESFVDVFTEGEADAALAASIFHDGDTTVGALKEALSASGIEVRQC